MMSIGCRPSARSKLPRPGLLWIVSRSLQGDLLRGGGDEQRPEDHDDADVDEGRAAISWLSVSRVDALAVVSL